jgi:hypothetical protein
LPGCDVMVPWDVFTAQAGAAFRPALTVDDGTWARGRGALSAGLLALSYCQRISPLLRGIARHAIAKARGDHERTGGHAP